MRDFIYNAFKTLDEMNKEESQLKTKLHEGIKINASLKEDTDPKYKKVLKKALTQLKKPGVFAVIIGYNQGKGLVYLDTPLVKKSFEELQDFQNGFRRGKQATKVEVRAVYPRQIKAIEELLKEDLNEGYVKIDEQGKPMCSLDGTMWQECSQEDYDNYLNDGYINLNESIKSTLESKLDEAHKNSIEEKEEILKLAESKGFNTEDISFILESKLHDDKFSKKDAYGYVKSLLLNEEKLNEELTQLNEKIPSDLAKLYRRGRFKMTKAADDRSTVDYGISSRRGTKVDFENTEYKEISKEEAKKLIKDKENLNYNLYHMVFIFNDPVTGEPEEFIKFNDKGKQIAKIDHNYRFYHQQSSGNKVFNSYFWSPKIIIDLCSKIYWTNEPEMKFEGEFKTNPKFNKKLQNLYDGKGWWSSRPFAHMDDKGELPEYNTEPHLNKRLINKASVDDTGKHKSRFSVSRRELNRKVGRNQQIANEYKQELADYLRDNAGNIDTYYVQRLKDNIEDYSERAVKDRKEIYYGSTEAGYLKHILKAYRNKIKVFKTFIDSLESKMDDIKDSNKHLNNYSEAKYQIEDLQSRIDECKKQIENLELQINELNNSYSEEDVAAYESLLNNEYNDLADNYEDIKAEYDALMKKPLGESLINEKYYRIYTLGDSGNETFIDDNWSNEEEVIDQAKQLCLSGDYVKVVVVTVDLEDSDDVNIIWTSEEDLVESKEKLTEGKKFNLKDEKEIVDATIYSGVEPEKEDELVAIDPNAESQNEDDRAKVGDALLECKTCKGIRTMSVDELEKDSDSDTYNKDCPCPHCGSKDGYNYIAQLANPESEEVKELNETEEVENLKDVVEEDEPELEPAEEVSDNGSEAVIESLDKSSLDKLITEHLTELYSNVKEYKSTSIKEDKELIVEGIITSNKGKELKTTFTFNLPIKTSSGSIVLEGYNTLLSEDKKAFKFEGKLENKSIILESLTYDYKVVNDGKEYQIISE